MRLRELLLLPLALAADDAPAVRVVTLDGRTIAAESLLPAGTGLEVRVGEGATTLELSEVLEAAFETADLPPLPAQGATAVEVDLVNRDLLRGTLVRGLGEEGFVVRSRALGEVNVPLDLVSSVRFPAAWEKARDPPPLRASERGDSFLFLSGDRLEGTLRSVSPEEVRVRASTGEDRSLRTDALLGFALAPPPPKPATGVRVQVVLADGSRLTASSLAGDGKTWNLAGTVDGKDRAIAASQVAGIAVRGGAGTCLSDLEPAKVEVRSFWGDDPPVLPLRPVLDRAFTLGAGAPPPLRLGGRTWLRGVSMFSGTTATWDLQGRGFRTFSAAVGVDDAGPKGKVEFEVLLDGRTAWRSGPLGTVAAGGVPAPVPALDVSGAKTLSLVVHAGPGDDVQDYGDWVRPVLR